MSGRSTAPEKRPGFFRQLRTLYTFTQKSFRWLPWLLAGIFVLSIGAGVAVGFLIPPVAWWSIVLWSITGAMLGILISLTTMTRLSIRTAMSSRSLRKAACSLRRRAGTPDPSAMTE